MAHPPTGATDEIVPALRRALEQHDNGTPALLEFIISEAKRFARKLPAGI